MSKYIPFAAQIQELTMQAKRRQHGLKTGDYVLWPDATVGPLIIRAWKIKPFEAEVGFYDYYRKQADILLEKAKTIETKS